MPTDLLFAIRHANRIIDWHENFSEDELPPVWMWAFDEELDAWFEQVKADRDAKLTGPRDDAEEVPLLHNEYARGRGGRS